MRGEAILRDLGAVGEPRGDHPPADCALHGAQSEDEPQAHAQTGRDPTAPQEEQERQQERCADHASQQPMGPFPPIDRLERRKVHAGIALCVLRDRLVFLKFGLPAGVRSRRQHAGDGPPLDDRQAGFGQTGRTTDQHQRDDEHRHGPEPKPDCPCVVIACRCHVGGTI